jgi:hypothetical protein
VIFPNHSLPRLRGLFYALLFDFYGSLLVPIYRNGIINVLIDFKGVNEIASLVTHILLIFMGVRENASLDTHSLLVFKGIPRILRGRQ